MTAAPTPLPIIDLADWTPEPGDIPGLILWHEIRASASALPSVRDDLPGGDL